MCVPNFCCIGRMCSFIDLQLFIPSVQIYGLLDIIPFHLQLSGSAKSLSSLLGLSTPRQASKSPSPRRWSRNSFALKSPYPTTALSTTISRASSVQPGSLPTKFTETCQKYPWSVQNPYLFIGSSPEDLTSLRSARTREQRDELVLRVYLLRQVSVRVNGQKAWRNRIIGEGAIWPTNHPPDIDDLGEGAGHSALDWAGELRVEKDVTVPSFAAGDLTIKVCHAVLRRLYEIGCSCVFSAGFHHRAPMSVASRQFTLC